MFFKYDKAGQAVAGKTLTLIVIVDQALKDSGAAIQPVIQQNGGSYAGYWSCQKNNADLLVGQETEISCTQSGAAPADGIDSLRLGFQLNESKNYLGKIEIVDATWE